MKHLKLYENFQNQERKYFTDSEITYSQKFWDWLHERHRNNQFFSKIWNQAKTKKSLTKKQWVELEFLLKNGKSRYEAGILPRNY
jgi:hypothetical protein